MVELAMATFTLRAAGACASAEIAPGALSAPARTRRRVNGDGRKVMALLLAEWRSLPEDDLALRRDHQEMQADADERKNRQQREHSGGVEIEVVLHDHVADPALGADEFGDDRADDRQDDGDVEA